MVLQGREWAGMSVLACPISIPASPRVSSPLFLWKAVPPWKSWFQPLLQGWARDLDHQSITFLSPLWLVNKWAPDARQANQMQPELIQYLAWVPMWEGHSFCWICSCEDVVVWSCGSYLATMWRQAYRRKEPRREKAELRDRWSGDTAWALGPSHTWSWARSTPGHSVTWTNKFPFCLIPFELDFLFLAIQRVLTGPKWQNMKLDK